MEPLGYATVGRYFPQLSSLNLLNPSQIVVFRRRGLRGDGCWIISLCTDLPMRAEGLAQVHSDVLFLQLLVHIWVMWGGPRYLRSVSSTTRPRLSWWQ